MSKLKIGTRITVGFCIVLLLLSCVAMTAFVKIKTMQANTKEATGLRVDEVKLSYELAWSMSKHVMYARGFLLYKDNSLLEKYREEIKTFEEKSNQLADLLTTTKGKQLINEIKASEAEYNRLFTGDLMAAEQANDDQRVKEIALGPMAAAGTQTIEGCQQMLDVVKGEMNKATTAASQAGSSAITVMITLTIIAILMGIVVAYFITAGIVKPVSALVGVANNLAKGDISVSIDTSMADEIGDLSRSMDSVVENIRTQATAAEKIAVGDLSVQITPKSDKDVLSMSFIKAVDTLRGMVDETKSLIAAAKEGNLEKRGNASRFQGGYSELIGGINEMLDQILMPIKEASEVLDKVANKDLSARVKGDYRGDHARIKDAINTAVDNIDQGMSQVAIGAEQVASAANQISSGSQALAQGASEQASALEEVSSSLAEMLSMTKQNTSNAKEAKGMADGAKGTATKGVESMTRLSDAIDRIKSSSDETAKIVKTIDEIAFQTNLLALNAAVEAARAGDAGKGFAVVAEEVRNLAMRSAEAAKNTANMIEDAVKNAEDGVAVNQEVLSNLDEINSQVNKVSEVMAEIAAASEQQSQGIDQINVAVSQMDSVTQQNAANSEESASAAEELSGQSDEMRNLVGSFKLSAQSGAMPSARAYSSPAPIKKEKVLVGASPAKKNGKNGSHDPAKVIPFDDMDTLQEF